ncbi:MAG: DNA-directed RNA polymerase subunit omega [Firmicutes bacterium]|nr:DNA-directed RNA polymerase subunit omega [Bacillota bacterium]MBQ9604239.1 DNA-directed RNA polymerase subunit omega [Bacillota bacterium]
MLRPSYAELMDVLNKGTEDNDVKSRYTVVIAAAKRARQLVDGHDPMIEEDKIKVDKALSIAIEEMNEGKIEVVPEGEGTVLVLKKDEPVEEVEEAAEEAAEDEDADEFGDDEFDGEEFDEEEADELLESLLSGAFEDDNEEDEE